MSNALSPIEENRLTLAAQVAERIRQAIFNRTLVPGSRINQYQLAEDLNVSLVPVREALKTLEAEGLVTITPRRGAFVTEISLDDLDELYSARQIIEGEAIRLACERLTEQDFVALREIMDKMVATTRADDIHTFMDYNRQFHMHIYGAINNRYLVQVIEAMWDRSEVYRYRYMLVLHNADVIHQEHEAIYAALQQGDAERAHQYAQEHIWHTRNGILRQLANEISSSEATNGDAAE